MYEYCLRELHFSEGTAYKYIAAARAVRRFPAILVALAEGRLHLRAILMLTPHLTCANADELVAAATHKTRSEIELLLAQRFPKPDVAQRLQAIPRTLEPAPVAAPAPALGDQLAPGASSRARPGGEAPGHPEEPSSQPARQPALEPVAAPVARPRLAPLSPERFALQLTIDQPTHDLLQRARALMSHQVPAREIAPVLRRALELLVDRLEKQNYAATARPRASKPCTSPRGISATVKRAVRERDGDRCAFVRETGKRCAARERLEFDHREALERGGAATVENVRLLCRAHNQHAAERAFGMEFMEGKRAEARRGGRTRAKSRGLTSAP